MAAASQPVVLTTIQLDLLKPLATQPVSGPLTNAELRLTDVGVSGNFYQATQPVSGPLTNAELRLTDVGVSGNFYQATQPVSGPLTNAELRLTDVGVSGNFYQATQPISGNVGITGALPTGGNLIGSVNVNNPGNVFININTISVSLATVGQWYTVQAP